MIFAADFAKYKYESFSGFINKARSSFNNNNLLLILLITGGQYDIRDRT